MHKSVLSLLILLLPACSVIPDSGYQPERTVEPRTGAAPEPRGDARLRSVMLDEHNRARRDVGAPPLQWDNALVASAQDYADELARSGRFRHDPDNSGPGKQGENLWMGTRGAYSHAEMVGGWIGERQYFKRGLFPDNSTTGKWQDVGHYTQIIWPTTTRVGCALASNARDDYLVCRYSPPGNSVGRDPLKG